MSSSTQGSADDNDLVEDFVPPEPCRCRGKPNATFLKAWTAKTLVVDSLTARRRWLVPILNLLPDFGRFEPQNELDFPFLNYFVLDIVPNAPDCKYFRWVDPLLTNKHYRILLMKMKAVCNGQEIARLTKELAGVKEKLPDLFLALLTGNLDLPVAVGQHLLLCHF
ncbi:hypothetical protein LXL04_025363 [Taraxacum kok-saghyz]